MRARRGFSDLVIGSVGDHGGVIGLLDLLDLAVGVGEPVGGPDAVERPAEPLQLLLPQPVAVPGGR